MARRSASDTPAPAQVPPQCQTSAALSASRPSSWALSSAQFGLPHAGGGLLPPLIPARLVSEEGLPVPSPAAALTSRCSQAGQDPAKKEHVCTVLTPGSRSPTTTAQRTEGCPPPPRPHTGRTSPGVSIISNSENSPPSDHQTQRGGEEGCLEKSHPRQITCRDLRFVSGLCGWNAP